MDESDVYQSDPNRAPDREFEPGELHHLVPGNRGRLLDFRRTPIEVSALRPDAGFFVVTLLAFEDEGARWEIPYEDAGHFQFTKGSLRAGASEVAGFRDAISRLDHPLAVSCAEEDRQRTLVRLQAAEEEAREWLGRHSGFFSGDDGTAGFEFKADAAHEPLWDDLERYLATHGLDTLESAFAERFVSNPYSGDVVKGHRIALARMGLVDYADKAPRDPDAFLGAWTLERRAEHIVRRIAFVRAFLKQAGLSRVTVYRGMSVRGSLEPPRNNTFVSASFSREVAESHFNQGDPEHIGVLHRQPVSRDRVFMTYLETRAMNRHFREAEAILLFDPENRLF